MPELNTSTRGDKSEKFRLPRSADSLSACLRREPRKRRQISQHGEYKHGYEKRPQHYGRYNERDRLVSGFLHDKPCALRRQCREHQYKQRVVMQREQNVAVQQLIHRPRPAAARTIQTRQRVKQTHGIKTVRSRVEEKQNGQRAKNGKTQNRARKKF